MRTSASKALSVESLSDIDLVKARRGITPDSAIRLGKAFGTGSDFWLNLQSRVDERGVGAVIELCAVKKFGSQAWESLGWCL
jgi:addiction module HigA family antidote